MLREIKSLNSLYESNLAKLWFYYDTEDPLDGLICDGRVIKWVDYPELVEHLNRIKETGTPRGDINLPDLRGSFLRGLGGGSAELGIKQGDAIRNIEGWFRVTVQHQDLDYNKYGGAFKYKSVIWRGDGGEGGWRETYDYALDVSRVVPTADENRPMNHAFNICIGTGRIGKKSDEI